MKKEMDERWRRRKMKDGRRRNDKEKKRKKDLDISGEK